MAVERADKVETSPIDPTDAEGQRPMAHSLTAPGDEQILQALSELRLEVSALRSEVLGQNQQMLSRIQFLHEGLIGRIKQMREQATPTRRRPGR
jgi:hypothetical protein